MAEPMIVANFMDSSLADLERKGVFQSIPDTYNPGRRYARVFHFTPHERDLVFRPVLARDGIELVHNPAVGLNPVKILAAIAKVWRVLGREHVDIVRGRLPYLGSLVGAVAARGRGIPMVVSLGGDNRIVQRRNRTYHYGSRALSYGMEWLVLRLATAIIVPNRFTRDYVAGIIGADAATRKCALIPWLSEPVGAASPRLLDELAITSEEAVVPIIGFLNRYKLTDVLFDALEGLDARTGDGRRVRFVFCGDGPLKQEGERRFAGSPSVLFAGWQKRETIHALMRRAELVLIPMSGFVLLEAASIGKPVVASTIEWHGEMVHDGETGLLVEATDPAAWRMAIARLLADPDAARRMGEHLKALYWRDYAPERAAALELALYERLSGKRAAAA